MAADHFTHPSSPPPPVSPPVPGAGVRQVLNLFLEEQELRRRGGLIGDRLLERQHRYLGAFAQRWGDLPAGDLRPHHITRFVLEHADEWGSDHTRENAVRTVKAAYRWAEENDVIPRNTIRRVQAFWGALKPRGALLPGEFEAIMRAGRRRLCTLRLSLSGELRDLVAGDTRHGESRADTAARILAESLGPGLAREVPIRTTAASRAAFRAALFFLWHTGARTNEMREADWRDLDWQAGILTLARSKTAKKTGQDRYIPLTAALLRLLGFIHRRRGRPKSGPIFLNGRGRPWQTGTFAKQFQRYARAAGIERHISPYCLRHSFAVNGLEAGVGERQLADVLGHTTTRYVGWYGRDVRAKSGYLRDIAERVRGGKGAP